MASPAFVAMSLPALAGMLAPADAYALSRASKQIKVCFKEIGFRKKIKFPKAYCTAAFCKGTEKWDLSMALFIYEDANCTPYKTKKRLIDNLFVKTMDRGDLVYFATQTQNMRVLRMAMNKKAGYFRDDKDSIFLF